MHTLADIPPARLPFKMPPMGFHLTIGGSDPLSSQRQTRADDGYIGLGQGWGHACGVVLDWLAELGAPPEALLQLQNPWGTLRGEPMRLDQYPQCAAHGPAWLRSRVSFVAGVRRITKTRPVVAYVGGSELTPGMADPVNEYDRDWWTDLAVRSVLPALEAGCWLAFDATSKATKGSPMADFLSALRDKGHTVMAEGWLADVAENDADSLPRQFTDDAISKAAAGIHYPGELTWDAMASKTAWRAHYSLASDRESILTARRKAREAGLVPILSLLNVRAAGLKWHDLV